jgi:hypothetical protein
LNFCAKNPPLRQAAKRYKQAEKKDNDRMTMKFLLQKDKEEQGKPSPQKQECGCPSLQTSLRSHTHAFFLPTWDKTIIAVKATTQRGAKTNKSLIVCTTNS